MSVLAHLSNGALVDAALINFLGKLSCTTGSKCFCLWHPLITAGTTFEACKVVIHPSKFCRAPTTDLVKMIDPHLVQGLFELRPNTLDLLKIIWATFASRTQKLRFAVT